MKGYFIARVGLLKLSTFIYSTECFVATALAGMTGVSHFRHVERGSLVLKFGKIYKVGYLHFA